MRIASITLALVIAVATLAPAQLVHTTKEAGTTKPLTPGLFSEICRDKEALVGIFGNAAGYVDRLGGYCVKIKADGSWDGEVRATNAYGGSGGTNYDRKCTRDSAISGFKGRAGMFVDRVQIQCRKLASPTSQTGMRSYISTVGGTGGTAYGPHECLFSKPAAGFGGQAVLFVDALFLFCRA